MLQAQGNQMGVPELWAGMQHSWRLSGCCSPRILWKHLRISVILFQASAAYLQRDHAFEVSCSPWEQESPISWSFFRKCGKGKAPLACSGCQTASSRKKTQFFPCHPNCTSSALHLRQGSRRRNTYQFKYAIKDKTISGFNFIIGD